VVLQGITAPHRKGRLIAEIFPVSYSVQIGNGYIDYYRVNGERWVRLALVDREASAPLGEIKALERIAYTMCERFGFIQNHLLGAIYHNTPQQHY